MKNILPVSSEVKKHFREIIFCADANNKPEIFKKKQKPKLKLNCSSEVLYNYFRKH